jgi:hypothetical protein
MEFVLGCHQKLIPVAYDIELRLPSTKTPTENNEIQFSFQFFLSVAEITNMIESREPFH